MDRIRPECHMHYAMDELIILLIQMLDVLSLP